MDAMQPRWTVSAVARRLGVAPATLRTWDRRYGLGPSDHSQGAHRRYDDVDLERLERMTTLLRQGVSTADAAKLALLPLQHAKAGDVPPPDRLDLTEIQRRRRGLMRAANALDAGAVLRQLEAALTELGVISAYDGVIRPVLIEAGFRWEGAGTGVDVEHLLSDCLIAALHGVVSRAPRPPGSAKPVLLVCAADEHHDLPLHALRAALSQHRVKITMLGRSTPATALATACRRIGPAAVAVWSMIGSTADPGMFEAVPSQRPAVAEFAAGPGWDGVALPERTHRVLSLGEAVDQLVSAAGGAATSRRSATL